MSGGRCILGMDVGGTYIRAGMVDEDHKIVCEKMVETADVMKVSDNCASLIRWTEELIEASGRKAEAVCLGLPAVLNKQRTTVLSAPNVVGLDNQPVAALLENALNIPTFMEKDACLLLYYDLYMHAIPMKGTLIGLYIGTGIGNAVIIDGVPYVGKNGSSCEIGHVPCLDKTDFCSCGNEACMEVYASGRALQSFCEQHFPETEIKDLFAAHADDPRVDRMIDRFAVPIATEINIFDPDYMVLGGGVLAMRDFPKDKLERSILKYTRKPVPASTIKLLYARPSQHNGIVGAALYARTRLQGKEGR